MIDNYQFPDRFLRSSTLCTIVEHGLSLKEHGRWVVPDFQRPLVWTVEQKISFIESLILNLPVGEYTLHRTPDYKYEILDGQQRWSAIFSYVNNEFPVYGLKWEDLNIETKRVFESMSFPHRAVEGLTREQKIDIYERLAYGGTAHTKPPASE